MSAVGPNDALRAALEGAFAASEETPASVSRAIGRDKDYIRDYLIGRKQSLGATAISEIEAKLSLAPGTLLKVLTAGGRAAPASSRPEPNARPLKAPPNLLAMTKTRGPKIPVLGIAVGGSDGDFRFNGQVVNYLSRPASIADAKDVYGLYVSNDSMSPLYDSGTPVFVDPHRMPAIGDCVVIEMHPDEDGSPGDGFIKRLVRRSASVVTVEQFNPAKELTFDPKEIKALHRVIPWRELLGL